MTRMLVRDPFFSDLAAIEQRLNSLFGQFFGNGTSQRWTPAVDVVETDEHYLVLADLPGIEQDKVLIELENGVLTISGERTMLETGEVRRFERIRVPKLAQRKPKRIALSGGRKELKR